MNNFKVHCRKSFRGCIDIRDFNVKRCIEENRNVEVTCSEFDGVMILTPKQLETPTFVSKKTFPSQVPGKPNYKLYSYRWNPTK